jgi:hypothetical protein
MAETPETNKPGFRNGFPIRDLRDGSMISGQADGAELVPGRHGDEFFAIGCSRNVSVARPPKQQDDHGIHDS